MSRYSSWGPLFLIEAEQAYEPVRHIHTCGSIEHALGVAPTAGGAFDDFVRVRAVQPGPGPGVTVARWEARRPEVRWPDGEGPPHVVQDWGLMRLLPSDPETGERVGPDFLSVDTVLWERVL